MFSNFWWQWSWPIKSQARLSCKVAPYSVPLILLNPNSNYWLKTNFNNGDLDQIDYKYNPKQRFMLNPIINSLLVMTNPNMKYENFVINGFQISSKNHFDIQDHCVLDLWPCDFKINRGHLLVMNNHFAKYKNLLINSFQENKQKPFWHSRSLWP